MPISTRIIDLYNSWDHYAMLYMTVGYIVLAISIIASLAVTAFADANNIKSVKIWGFIAAVCTALVASLDPIQAGFRFRDAWRVLNIPIIACDQGKCDQDKLLAAVEEGEKIIGAIPAPTKKLTETLKDAK